MARVLIVFPMISGVFFGVVSVALVTPLGGFGRATEVGLLVGAVMFTANAAALCIVQASAWDAPPRPVESVGSDPIGRDRISRDRISEARAS